MVIEHAERFGLAQLHQLRGRIGRGQAASTCLLLYATPLGETARARLAILRETDDGFRIAEEDFRLRGPGESPRHAAKRPPRLPPGRPRGAPGAPRRGTRRCAACPRARPRAQEPARASDPHPPLPLRARRGDQVFEIGVAGGEIPPPACGRRPSHKSEDRRQLAVLRCAKAPRTGCGRSFETLAALAPQDEVKSFCHTQICLILRSAPEGRVSRDPRRCRKRP